MLETVNTVLRIFDTSGNALTARIDLNSFYGYIPAIVRGAPSAFNAPDPARPRWGDYGAAVSDGNSIWMAAEYINQTCTFAQYVTGAFGSCGGTRASLGNWSTRISKVTP